jgi:23S rRNA (uracil1939-C5)-methyltransferase
VSDAMPAVPVHFEKQPFCVHFTVCGGCVSQHMDSPLYLEWKKGLVEKALNAAGIDATVDECRPAHGAGRRRATLHARRSREDGVLRTGFAQAGSHALVDLVATDCPLFEKGLQGAAAKVHMLAKALVTEGRPVDAVMITTGDGLDIDLRGAGKVPDAVRRKLAQQADMLDLARLSLDGDVVVERRPPRMMMGQVSVTLPPGGFCQATAVGEALLADLVLEGVGKAKKVADLFAGSGTFSLRLAEHAQVHAVESERASLAALDNGWRYGRNLKKVTHEVRDLFKRPLVPLELNHYDAVVFDPPRAGALAQVAELARSKVRRVVAVSCNPATLARDLKILVGGGYTIKRVVPVDQFWHSTHIESVVWLTRGT